MNATMAQIGDMLRKFPEVSWDRWAGELQDHVVVFGWIKRGDGQRDFMLLIFDDGEMQAYCTSSAKYSADFGKRLGFETHHDCRMASEFLDGDGKKWDDAELLPEWRTA